MARVVLRLAALATLALAALAALPALSAPVVLPVPGTAAGLGAERILGGLSFPVNVAFAPDGRLFFAEKDTGDIRVVVDGRLRERPVAHVDVLSSAEQGLLGLALDPRFPAEPWLYVYYSDPATLANRLMRIRIGGGSTERQPLLDLLTTERGYHNGGDLAFGTDGTLFVAVGEVHEPQRAQDPNDLGGKILRLNPDGSIPKDNPFGPDNPVYSLGHRNSFGLCVDPANGQLWETENGPTSDDELNRIEAGGNYGWPDQLGPGGAPRFIDPIVDFPQVIVPTGCAMWRGALYFGAYGNGLLYRVRGLSTPDAEAVVVRDMGAGVTDLQVGPDGNLYVSTADAIWRLETPATSTPPSSARTPGNDGADGSSAGAIVAWAALALIAVALVVRLRAGRALRRR